VCQSSRCTKAVSLEEHCFEQVLQIVVSGRDLAKDFCMLGSLFPAWYCTIIVRTKNPGQLYISTTEPKGAIFPRKDLSETVTPRKKMSTMTWLCGTTCILAGCTKIMATSAEQRCKCCPFHAMYLPTPLSLLGVRYHINENLPQRVKVASCMHPAHSI